MMIDGLRSMVIGRGEIGDALFKVLSARYGQDVASYDIKDAGNPIGGIPEGFWDIFHICIPYSEKFVEIVNDYIDDHVPSYVIVHSSVPVGTCEKLKGVVFHSPVRGKHPNIEEGLRKYVKYVGYHLIHSGIVMDMVEYLQEAGIKAKPIAKTETTELMKLLELSRYGVYIAFAKEQESICKQFNLDFDTVVNEYITTYNEGVSPELRQPIIYPFKDYVGGHCTVEDMELLLGQVSQPILREAHKIDKATTIWNNCNIYPTAKIGKGCSIGQFTEIGNNVVIGNGVRIGAYVFIPEGVVIEDGVFIAPRVSFSNDKHPPSGKENWGKVRVCRNSVIGMGAVILPGVTVGENAVVGAGAIVTKDVPAGEVWYGAAAYSRGKRNEVYSEEVS